MNPNHCVSLELAKELKEAEWKKETELWWEVSDTDCSLITKLKVRFWEKDYIYPGQPLHKWNFYSAPLATEILEELPSEYESWITIIRTKPSNGYRLLHRDIEVKIGLNLDGDNLPNALAKMWLYLKKEKLL
jgi:hypothetical protein